MNEAGQILDSTETKAPDAIAPQDNKQLGDASTDGTSPANKADERVSSKLEILIRREEQARAREMSAKAKEKEIEEKLKRIQDFEGIKSNPKKALEMLGLSYDELTRSVLEDGQTPPDVEIRRLKEELEAFKSETKQVRQTDEEKRELEVKRLQEDSEKKAIDGFKTEINQYLSDNKTRYELIEFEGQQELVYAVVDEHYNRTINPETGVGKVMSISEAADKVELHLEKKEIDRKKLTKVQTLWGSLPKAVQETVIKQEPARQTPKTLTNTLSAAPAKPRKNPITDEERIQKAIAYAKGLRP